VAVTGHQQPVKASDWKPPRNSLDTLQRPSASPDKRGSFSVKMVIQVMDNSVANNFDFRNFYRHILG